MTDKFLDAESKKQKRSLVSSNTKSNHTKSNHTKSNPTLNYTVNQSHYHIRYFSKSTSTWRKASDALDQLFTQLLRPAIQGYASQNDRITVSIHNHQITKGQLYINKNKSHFKIQNSYLRLLNLAQSNEKILLNGFFRVVIGVAKKTRKPEESIRTTLHLCSSRINRKCSDNIFTPWQHLFATFVSMLLPWVILTRLMSTQTSPVIHLRRDWLIPCTAFGLFVSTAVFIFLLLIHC